MSFSYLSDSDRERLRGLPFDVALPGRLPAGWSIKPFQVFHSSDEGEEGEASVDVAFAGPDSAIWSVSSTNGGIGDALPGEVEHNVQNLTQGHFGNIQIHSFREDDVAEVLSDWFPEEEDADCYHSFRGANVSQGDLQALVASLGVFSG